MRISIKPIGNRQALLKTIERARGLFNDGLTEMAKGAKRDFEDVVSEWKHKPQFEVVGTKNTVAIRVTGANAKIFGYVDAGTRPHTITAKRRRTRRGKAVLTFRTGYKARTRPNNTRFKGPGIATGPFRSAKSVRHPGTKPRNISRIISRRWREEGRKILRAKLRVARLPR